ncbi:MAG: adenylate/guanylate cyclase domain-containing protein, partial [Ardenticatenales bacterium]|nr:adenylate/guanylate cyclase domain-containing protein [Ardenticatenales bacterium]
MHGITASLGLAQAVAAYLPEIVVADLVANSLQAQGSPSLLVEPRCFDAVTMMVDITGFTPLCEALAKKGREGAEQVTELINSFFAQALRPVQEQGGVIAKFGGDAFNAFFARREGESWDEVLQRALYSAFALQALVLDYEGLRLPAEKEGEAQLFRLYAKVGLSAGAILTFGVGTPDRHCDFQVAGASFNEAAEAEHHASRGEIVLHQNFLGQSSTLQEQILRGERRETCYPAHALHTPTPAALPAPYDLSVLDATALEQLLSQAVAFVPQRIYERLALGYLALPGEHRRVISLFVHFTGFSWIEDPTAPAHFHDYYLAILEEVERYGGNLNRISSGNKGDLLHIIFGAPVSHEDDEAQAVRCALALQAVARRFDYIGSQKIGLSSGFVFAGDIGSPGRHEYTIIG